MFKVGSRVVWKETALHEINIGTVVRVVPCDSELPEFTLYDVKFGFGVRTLHGSELSTIRLNIPSCHEKAQLQTVCMNASDNHVRGAYQLAEAAGIIAHAKFELLSHEVDASRHLLREARAKLDAHTAGHGC